jgi:predicted nucleotidyltransferase
LILRPGKRASLKEELEERLGCPVDLLSRPAVERSRNPYRRRSILENLISVYAR